MWILDSANRGDGVDLWIREGTTTKKVHRPYDPPFYLSLPDPDAHHAMIEALEDQYRAEACTFKTIFGEHAGYKIFAGREIAEAIEQQTMYEARLFNVDLRRDQRFMAENGIFPCSPKVPEVPDAGDTDQGRDFRFSPVADHDLRQMEIRIRDNPARSRVCTGAEITCGSPRPGRGLPARPAVREPRNGHRGSLRAR
ncbi:MAG: hypothetical protein LUP97_03720 [Methanoregula sp.]|nr:hypothetical protein [Methanoregula sp.]